MKNYILAFLLTLCLAAISQVNPVKHMMNWHFGTACSINFNSGSPVAGTSSINTFEGCASISDKITGSLLFYTDGENVYDKLGNLMPNGIGLFGSQTSAQSAIILPATLPSGSPSYYIFTSDQSGYIGTNKGVYYSIVDMNLNSGLGDIITKNVPLLNYRMDEKLAAVRNCNGEDFWLITHRFLTDSFFVFPVTGSGIGAPVVSKIGSVHQNISGQSYEGSGCLAVSPDGDKLALAVYDFQNIVEMFYFNQFNGQISNPITLNKTDMGLNIFQPYGMAFSPDSRKLYFTHTNENMGGPASSIFQVDLNTWTHPTILSSLYLVNSITNNYYFNIALGPNNKIYAAKGFYMNQQYIDAISNPNNAGVACSFVSNAVQLPGTVSIGLPSFYKELIAGDESCSSVPTSIKENTNAERMRIYPNPSSGVFNFDLDPERNYKIEVIDPLGKTILEKNCQQMDKTSIDLSTLSEKLVIIKITDDKGIVTISKGTILK